MNSSAPVENTIAIELLPDDKTILGKQLQLEDKNSLGKDTEHFYRMGFILAKMKYQYFKRCNKCKSELNIFAIVLCKGCTKVSNGNTFFEDVKKLQLEKLKKTMTDDYFNFYIRFAGLCNTYPKLRLISWNSTKLKKYMTKLTKQIGKETSIWS